MLMGITCSLEKCFPTQIACAFFVLPDSSLELQLCQVEDKDMQTNQARSCIVVNSRTVVSGWQGIRTVHLVMSENKDLQVHESKTVWPRKLSVESQVEATVPQRQSVKIV